MNDREQVVARLAQWQQEKPWARRDPRTLAIASVARTGLLQAQLRTEYEVRGVVYELTPAPIHLRKQDRDALDLWAIPLEHPERAPVGHEVRSTTDRALVFDCAVCTSSGERACIACVGAPRRQARCEACGTRGTVVCDSCQGSGVVAGRATAWSRIDALDELRMLGGSHLPTAVAFELADSPEPGEIVHRREGTRVDGAHLSQGYRDGPLPHEIVSAIDLLLRGSNVPKNARLRRQILQIQRAPVLEVSLENGARFYVWGTPVKVHPRAPVSTALGKLFAR